MCMLAHKKGLAVRKMALWVRALALKLEGLSSNPQHPYQKPDEVGHTPVTLALVCGDPWGLLSASFQGQWQQRLSQGTKAESNRVGHWVSRLSSAVWIHWESGVALTRPSDPSIFPSGIPQTLCPVSGWAHGSITRKGETRAGSIKSVFLGAPTRSAISDWHYCWPPNAQMPM